MSLPSLSHLNLTTLKGKKIVVVADDLSNPFDVQVVNGIKAAAAALGANVSVLNGQGTPTAQNAAVLQAVSEHPAGIITHGIVLPSIEDAYAEVQHDKIPFMMSSPGAPPNVPYYVTENWTAVGTVTAALADSLAGPSHAGVGVLETNILTNIKVATDKLQSSLAQECPSCTISPQNMDLTTEAQDSGPDATGMVQSHNVKVLVAAVDPILLYAVPALKLAHDNIYTIGMAGAVAANYHLDETSSKAFDVTTLSNEVLGWLDVDQLGRAISHKPAAPSEEALPFAIVDKADYSTVYPSLTPSNYQAQLKKVWGVS